MGGERPARPQEVQGLGLTDSLWEVTLRCWQQDPAHRPTVTEVVEFLREWSVFSLSMEPASLHSSCSYRLRAMNPPLSGLASCLRAESVNAAMSRTLISRVPANKETSPTGSMGNLRLSDQTDFQIQEISSSLDPVFDSSSSCESLLDKPRTSSHSGNSSGDHILSIVY